MSCLMKDKNIPIVILEDSWDAWENHEKQCQTNALSDRQYSFFCQLFVQYLDRMPIRQFTDSSTQKLLGEMNAFPLNRVRVLAFS